jgi:hypothetical protein
MKVSNETVYVAIIICLIGFLIVVAPLIVKNDEVRKFTLDKYNLILLLVFAIVIFFLDIRVGAVFTILLLTFLSYSKLEGFNMSMYKETNKPTEYAKQFSLYTPQTLERNPVMAIETFDSDCGNKNDKLPSEQFEDTENIVPEGTPIDETVSSVALTTEDTAMTSNVSSYMNQLQQDALTNKLMSEQHDYDVMGCRYDMAEAGQSTALNGSPLGWNDTYGGKSINGQLFYPLHG